MDDFNKETNDLKPRKLVWKKLKFTLNEVNLLDEI